MVEIYTCSICKDSSQFKGNIDACEEQGVKNRFQIGQRITFINDAREVSGVINDIYVVPRSHRILYSVERAHGGGPVTVADDNIIRAEPKTTPTT